ncbi:MAG: type II secretion system protein GspG [Verrucomicrobiota bacterium]
MTRTLLQGVLLSGNELVMTLRRNLKTGNAELLIFGSFVAVVVLVAASVCDGGSGGEAYSKLSSDFASLEAARKMYEQQHGSPPASMKEIRSLFGELPSAFDFRDPWGNPYRYRLRDGASASFHEFYSCGRDGIEGSEDDISSKDR